MAKRGLKTKSLEGALDRNVQASPVAVRVDPVQVIHGDSREALKLMADASVDSVVCDPPYALVSITKRFANSPRSERTENTENPYGRPGRGFMGQRWDTGETAFDPAFWEEVLRVLKPGAHLIAFGGTRTYHRLVCAIEDAGFEIRDQLAWLFGSGFPKSHDVSKGIDRTLGAEGEKVATAAPVKRMIPGADQNKAGWEKNDGREFVPHAYAPATPEAAQWQGWGTALKPAHEPICLARKPLAGTVAANVLQHGTGALNIDASRIEGAINSGWSASGSKASENVAMSGANYAREPKPDNVLGRWPANVIHDGSEEVLRHFPEADGQQRPIDDGAPSSKTANVYGERGRRPGGFGNVGAEKGDPRPNGLLYGDAGSAARFFYCAKADADDRLASKHPTVKPVDLMAYLVRLVTPPGGLVLDPFAGSGTTGMACMREGFRAVLIEREAEYVADIKRRIAHVKGEDAPLFAEAAP